MELSVEDRFWAKVEKTDDCWLWTACADVDGYGQMRIGGKGKKAHRISYEIAYGPIPDGMFVDHICHVPACVRPEHLRLATPKQNLENRAGATYTSRSGVRGVYAHISGRWQVKVGHNGKSNYVGLYEDIRDAEAAAIAKRNELFTHNDADRAGGETDGAF